MSPPLLVFKALVHSIAIFTTDVYSHIISALQEDAMVLIDVVLPSGIAHSSGYKNQAPVHLTYKRLHS